MEDKILNFKPEFLLKKIENQGFLTASDDDIIKNLKDIEWPGIMMGLEKMKKELKISVLYQIVFHSNLSFELRKLAAVNLSISCCGVPVNQSFLEKLFGKLNSSDRKETILTALSLGWEGNFSAIYKLKELLKHCDPEITEAAVSSLISINNIRILSLIYHHIEEYSQDTLCCLAANLWRMQSFYDEVLKIYSKLIDHDSFLIRLDALYGLEKMADRNEKLRLLKKCVEDPVSIVKKKAIGMIGFSFSQ